MLWLVRNLRLREVCLSARRPHDFPDKCLGYNGGCMCLRDYEKNMTSSKDVAKHAGVSQATVSRVLNRPETVAKETREKVVKSIEALGYIPDANARSLVGGKSHTIALISGPLHNAFFVDSTSDIINYANRLGYKVNVHFSDGNIDDVYDNVLSQKVDGLIMSCVLWDDPVVERLQKLNLPFISFNRRHEFMGNYVEMDNFSAGRLAVRHLIEKGHRQILWIGGSMRMSTFRNRYLGFRHECDTFLDENGQKLLLSLRTVNYKETDRPDLAVMIQSLQNNGSMPTAICAATDSLAMNAMNHLISMGFSVPDDISVIGIDNVRLSGTPLVELTTIGVADGSHLGDIAIRRLVGMLEKRDMLESVGETRITKSVALFERKTTKRLR